MKTKDISKSLQTKLESQALGNVQIVSRKIIKDTRVKTGRKYHKHQDKNQEQSKRTGQDTSLRNRTSTKTGQDTSFTSRSKEQGRTRHQGIRTRVRSKARRQDKTQASRQDKQQDRTRHRAQVSRQDPSRKDVWNT